MNKEVYVRRMVKRLRCSSTKKKEIKKQLETDIAIRLEQGEVLEEIMAEMGSPAEFAEGFRENMSDADWRKYRWERVGSILLAVCITIALVTAFLYYMLPRVEDISDSQYFDTIEVGNQMMEVVQLLDENNYDTLQSLATERMKAFLTEEVMMEARGTGGRKLGTAGFLWHTLYAGNNAEGQPLCNRGN
jgi:hypothetical protein